MLSAVKALLRPAKKRCLDFYRKKNARKKLARWRKCKVKHNKIRVGFIMQYPPIWNKQQALFERMSSNDDFEVIGLLVPDFEGSDVNVNEEKRYVYGNEHTYFHSIYKNVVDVIVDGSVIDIKELNLDYVFYQRPYDILLPAELRTKNVIDYARTLYIAYAYTGALSIEKLQLGCKDFYTYLYCYFTESGHVQELFKNDKYYGELYQEGLLHYHYLGYPMFNELVEKERLLKNKSHRIKILWTPRWTYDKNVGGSHFFEYYKELIGFHKDNENVQLIIRPHPLMFKNFISQGLITEKWKEDFFAKLKSLDIAFDTNKDVNDTFSEIDVLITDYSSIIVNYCFGGKPMIYCPSACNVLNTSMAELMNGGYIATNWDEVKSALDEIIMGNDRLKEVREAIKEKLYKEHENAIGKIINQIKRF